MGNIYNQMNERLEEVPLNIYSPIFKDMLEQLDKELQRVLINVYEGKFESGNVKVSLNVEINEAILEVPTTDRATGEVITIPKCFRKPKFEYKTNSTLNKKHEIKGEYNERREIILEDEKFIARSIYDPQIKFDVIEGGTKDE